MKNKLSPSKTKGTLAYFKRTRWKHMNTRCYNGKYPDKSRSHYQKGILLNMSKTEFYAFCDANQDKILDMYLDGKVPSLDRIDSNKHYSLNNIQIMELTENVRKK